jgi:hypothetical protein
MWLLAVAMQGRDGRADAAEEVELETQDLDRKLPLGIVREEIGLAKQCFAALLQEPSPARLSDTPDDLTEGGTPDQRGDLVVAEVIDLERDARPV